MCLWIWRGRSLLCLLIFHSNYTGKNRNRWGLCPTTCWRISHTTCRHMHALLNKSEVLTRRPFSKQLNTSCWNSYKHSGCRKVSNVFFKSKTQHEGFIAFFFFFFSLYSFHPGVISHSHVNFWCSLTPSAFLFSSASSFLLFFSPGLILPSVS